MATKLYLQSTTTNGISDTGDGVVYDLSITSPGLVPDVTNVVTLTAGGSNIQWTNTEGGSTVAWISPPLSSGFTLTTTDFQAGFIEGNANDNAGGRIRIYKYTPGTPTITELAGGPFDDGVEFDSMANTQMAWIANPTDTAFSAGDRILLRVFATNVGTMTAGNATISFRQSTSFLNINENITFSTAYTLTLDSGSYSLTGTALTITSARNITLDSGSYSLTGNDVALKRGYTIVPDSGSYALTGTDVSLTSSRSISLDSGSYALTGNDLGLTRQYTIVPDSGVYTLTGNDVNLVQTTSGRILASSRTLASGRVLASGRSLASSRASI